MQFVTWFSGAYSRICSNFFAPMVLLGPSEGPCVGLARRATRLASPVALRVTDAEPLTNALICTRKSHPFCSDNDTGTLVNAYSSEASF